MLLIEPHSEVLDAWRDIPPERRRLGLLFLDKKGDFRVPLSKHASIIDIGTANDQTLIVSYDQLRVYVEDFCKGQFFLSGAMLPEAIELQIIINVLNVGQSLVQ